MTTRPPGALPENTDVLIVGAGPTGLVLACTLAQRGIPFVLLDRAAEGGNTSRAAVVHARTLEVLEDVAITDELVRCGVLVPTFTIRDRDRTLLRVPFGDLSTPYPYTLMVPQSITEQVLHRRLVELGGTVHRERTATALQVEGGGVTAVVTGPDGTPTRVRARYLAGCDGMHSVVRAQTGIAFTGDRYAQSFVLADLEMDWPLGRDEVQLFFSPQGLVVVAPLPDGRYRVVATLDHAPDRPGVELMQALLTTRGPATSAARVHDLVWSSRFSVHHRLAQSYRRGPVFLAGDAAHVHSPAGGQGMNLGIQDAAALAALLADVLSGCRAEASLDTYETTRRPVARDVVAATHRITRAATAKTPAIRTLRNTALTLGGRFPTIQRKLSENLSGLAAQAAAEPAAGRRDSWTRARLIAPLTSGFVHIGAVSGPWRLPVALPRVRRRAALAMMASAAAVLREDPRVVRADVFRGLLRPPGQAQDAGPDLHRRDVDSVLLIETTSVQAASGLSEHPSVVGLVVALHQASMSPLVFTGSNVRRIGSVEHDRQGVFLFNYFSADDVETNLSAWQYTAGWFQHQTGLDNSTVLQPTADASVPYTLVNHCRWDHLRNVLPSLLFDRSFRSFVLQVFADNRVTPHPILFRLHASHSTLRS